MSERKNSFIALLIVFLALLIIGLLEALLMGSVPDAAPEPLAQAVQGALKYRDGVVVVWDRQGRAHWILGNARLLQERFLPGSLMKLITAETAHRQGVELKYRCEGHRNAGGHRENCWKPEGHGDLDLPRALAHSCNLYFSQLGAQLGWNALRDTLGQYSFGSGPTEAPDAETLRKLAIGEDREFTVTPLEMTRFWEQYLGKMERGEFPEIREGLRLAALEGTAQDAVPGDLPILAKTGTAGTEAEPYKTHGWFLGAYPLEKPQWAVMIFLKNAHGYREAAQLGGRIFKEITSWEKERPLRGEKNRGEAGACGSSEARWIRVQDNRTQTLNTLSLEDYVSSVLASELPEDFPMEALKAQAVLIRTLALHPTQNHRLEGFDFCDTTHCQLFHPPRSIPEKFLQAVRSTKGQVLNHGGKPIEVLYHSQCGGHTSPNQRVFGGAPLPYLQGVDDSNYCQDGPQQEWESSLSLNQLEKILHFSPLRQIRLRDGEPQGRVFTLTLEGDRLESISAQDFLLRVGKKLGWEKIKSAWFTLETRGDRLAIKGKGLGHGVGLCQWGARGMAMAGSNYREILRHYFPGTRVEAAP